MSRFEKGNLLVEGKTKKIFEIRDESNLVLIENKVDITAHNDPKFTKEFKKKAEYANNTTCRVFELLKEAGIPVAYREQFSETEFLADKCSMIPLEMIARRDLEGSYLKRHPEFVKKEGELPHRLHKLLIEFFLKTTKGKFIDRDGKTIIEGLTPEENDPFISNPFENVLKLFHPKKPIWSKGPFNLIDSEFVFQNNSSNKELSKITRDVFLILEGAFASLNLRLIDFKIEFGLAHDGRLVVADVIDNDSWRLKTDKWEELSKEAFRQGEEMNEVERKYGIVSNIVNNFQIPKQSLVVWRGSDKDGFPKIGEEFENAKINIEDIVISGHKSPLRCLNKLEEILSKYPAGGVILTKVGMSNGLGPTLAARTSWPVIAVPAGSEKKDVWSSLRMPSNVPMSTILSETNAMLYALNIFAQKNPLAYWQRQRAIEKLDD